MGEAWLTRRTFAWAAYDVANSVYIGLAPTVLLPIYFSGLLKGQANPTAVWGALVAFAVLASSLAAVASAAMAGRFSRFSLLASLSLGLVAAIGALAWNPGASLLQAALAYVAAQVFYFAATAIYESFLPDLLPRATRQTLSGFGWALGYLGGFFAIVVLLVVIDGRPQTTELLRTCFGVLAVVSAVFFAAALAMMRREGFASLMGASGARSVLGVFGALRQWRSDVRVLRLLLGTMLVQMVTSVVVVFTAPILASRFGQDLQDLLWLLLLIHVLSVPTTFGWNFLMSRGSRPVHMAILLAAWMAVLLLLAFGSGPWMPIATVTVIGCCLGATAAALRGFLAESVNLNNSVAMFGLFTVAGRAAAALGPGLFSVLTLAGGERTALLAIMLVLAGGGALVLLHLLRDPSQLEGAAPSACG